MAPGGCGNQFPAPVPITHATCPTRTQKRSSQTTGAAGDRASGARQFLQSDAKDAMRRSTRPPQQVHSSPQIRAETREAMGNATGFFLAGKGENDRDVSACRAQGSQREWRSGGGVRHRQQNADKFRACVRSPSASAAPPAFGIAPVSVWRRVNVHPGSRFVNTHLALPRQNADAGIRARRRERYDSSRSTETPAGRLRSTPHRPWHWPRRSPYRRHTRRRARSCGRRCADG